MAGGRGERARPRWSPRRPPSPPPLFSPAPAPAPPRPPPGAAAAPRPPPASARAPAGWAPPPPAAAPPPPPPPPPPGHGTVSGTVSRVTYRAPDSDYVVLRVRADAVSGAPASAGLAASPARPATVTVVGSLPGVREGAVVTFGGAWGDHPRFGCQLAASTAAVVPPSSRDGTAAMLAGARLPGVGPAIAARIVDALGPAALAVLDSGDAARALARVNGVSPKKAALIKAAWDADRGARGAAEYVRSLPAPPRLAAALLREHGGAAQEALTADPHAACASLDGASFKAVDGVAAAVGAPPGAPSRGGAALAAVARAAAAAGGHTCVPWADATVGALKLMAASGRPWPPGAGLSEAAADAVARGELVVEPPPPPALLSGGGVPVAPPAAPAAPAAPAPTAWGLPAPSNPAPLTPVAAASLRSYLTTRVPGVGGATAERLVAAFGAGVVALLDAHSAAAERGLTAAPGVGPSSARRFKAGWDANRRRLPPWRAPVEGGGRAAAPPAPRAGAPPASPSSSPSWPPPDALVYTADLHAAEAGVAAALAARARPPPPAAAAAAAAAARRWLATATPPGAPPLSPGQADAVVAAATHKVVLLTGGPGTGKTAVTAALLSYWRSTGVRAALAAPTGRAAQRLAESAGAPATTLHRLLDCRGGGAGSDGDDDRGDDGPDAATRFRHGPANPLPHDAVLVDEASLLDAPLAAALLAALRPGAALVLVGDGDQLPPIGPGAILADAAASSSLPRVHLTHVFRQGARSAIVAAAHAAHAGAALPLERAPREALAGAGPSTALAWTPTTEAVRVDPCPAAAAAAGLPLGFAELAALVTRTLPAAGFDPVTDVQVLTPVRRGGGGTAALNAFLGELLNPGAGARGDARVAAAAAATATPPPFALRVGDRVMQATNNYDLDVFNGETGVVVSVERGARGARVVFPAPGHPAARTVSYAGPSLADLHPAWAATVHKAQGGEAPAVVLFLDGGPSSRSIASRALLYTALTRARKLVIVIAPDGALAAAAAPPRAGAVRRTSLAARLREAVIEGGGAAPAAAA